MQHRIYILEGNVEIAKMYGEIFQDSFETHLFATIEGIAAALESAEKQNLEPDLIIAELEFTDGSLLQEDVRLTSFLQRLPVLIVTNLDDLVAIQATLNSWANDYLTKPINNNELMAKSRQLVAGKRLYVCDAVSMTIKRLGAKSEGLTANEFRLLTLILQSQNYSVTNQSVAKAIWGQNITDQRLHTMLSRLRPKIKNLDLQLEMIKDDSILLRVTSR